MLESNLTLRFKQVNSWISALQKSQDSAPSGTLHVVQERGTDRYYLYQGKGAPRRYLGKKDEELIARLAQKQYDTLALKILCHERELLDSLLCHDAKKEMQHLTDCIPQGIAKYIDPLVLDDDAYAGQWASMPYEPKPIDPASAFSTVRGDFVRSKSEVIIANTLYQSGVPYRYEYPLEIPLSASSRILHPDFTVLNVRTRQEFHWEHFGMMDDDNYRHNALKKIEDYATAGYFHGKQMIFTFEGSGHPFNTKTIGLNIKAFLQ